jgi:hypothetical protein
MHSRFGQGEVILALLFGALGILWMVTSFGMPFWQGFAPQSGFVPFWYGVILTGLSVTTLINILRRHDGDEGKPPVGKPLVVLAALAAGILGLEAAGFAPAVFLLLLFLFAVVERLPLARSALVAAVTTAILLLLFKVWLGVRLPTGPLGI